MLLVMTNPKKGQEDEFNDWYTNIHLPQVVSLPGFIRAKRFESNVLEGQEPPQFKYLALYEVEGDRLDEARQALSDTLDASNRAIEAGEPPMMSPGVTIEEVRIVQWFDYMAEYP